MASYVRGPRPVGQVAVGISGVRVVQSQRSQCYSRHCLLQVSACSAYIKSTLARWTLKRHVMQALLMH